MKNPEHRVQTTKRRLREALLSLLPDKPLRAITVKELCESAQLNRGTFYAHYSDVYDLMAQIEEDMRAGFFAALAPMMREDAPLSPPQIANKVFECIEANVDLCRVVIGPHGDKEFTRRLLRESREMSVPYCLQAFPNADRWKIECYFTFVSGGCYALMERWLRDGMPFSAAELAGAASKIMAMGLAYLQ